MRRVVFAFFLSLAAVCVAQPPWIADLIQDESGFDGAVTVEAVQVEGNLGYVTVNVPYLDVRGERKMGQGRVIVSEYLVQSDRKLGAFCHVHYEKGVGGAKRWCETGWAVFTAHYGSADKGEYPLDVPVGDSYNLARAIIQWARRLPFIDRARLHIDGGSAGGYMALAMAADAFPVRSVTADMPVVNWAYNLNYFEANKGVSGYGTMTDVKESPVPVMFAVTMIADWSYGVFGNDLGSDTWYYLSPISYLNRITCPAQIVCATGDMLVPLEQMMRERIPEIDATVFPEGFARDFDTLTVNEKARKTFVEFLLEDEVFIHVQELPENVHEYTREEMTGGERDQSQAQPSGRPYALYKQWSILVLDEGAPLPHSPHSRYKWATSREPFVNGRVRRTPSPDLLNAAKLDWLLRRYAGEATDGSVLADGTPTHRLNFTVLEQHDVVTGLLDYAALGEAHSERLQALYSENPLKSFGAKLNLEKLKAITDGLL
jgi:acetyl esterase/lipase